MNSTDTLSQLRNPTKTVPQLKLLREALTYSDGGDVRQRRFPLAEWEKFLIGFGNLNFFFIIGEISLNRYTFQGAKSLTPARKLLRNCTFCEISTLIAFSSNYYWTLHFN